MPVLLFDLVNRAGLLSAADRERFWPMLRAAAAHLVREGPSVQQDRWENARGFTPFTLANMIAALIVAAQQADEQGESETGEFFRDTADAWCDSIDYWTYVHDTPLGRAVGVPGYYLRVAPPDQNGEPLKYVGPSTLQFRPARDQDRPPSKVVSVDALAYVRFGVRARPGRTPNTSSCVARWPRDACSTFRRRPGDATWSSESRPGKSSGGRTTGAVWCRRARRCASCSTNRPGSPFAAGHRRGSSEWKRTTPAWAYTLPTCLPSICGPARPCASVLME